MTASLAHAEDSFQPDLFQNEPTMVYVGQIFTLYRKGDSEHYDIIAEVTNIDDIENIQFFVYNGAWFGKLHLTSKHITSGLNLVPYDRLVWGITVRKI